MFGISELQLIKKSVCKRVLKEILINITESISCEILYEVNGEYQIKDKYGEETIKPV